MKLFPEIPKSIISLIENSRRVVVSGHLNPDGDCANSVLATGLLLEKLGKDYRLTNDGSFSRTEIFDFEEKLSDVPDSWLNKDTLGIVVDCASADRLGKNAEIFKHFTLAIIDHHSSSDVFSQYTYSVPSSPSTTLLIYKLFKALNVKPDKQAATYLFRGFSTDSGFFRFLSSGTEECFEIIADLVSLGVSPAEEYAKLNSGRSFSSVRYLSTLIERTESYFDGKLMISYEEESDSEVFGSEAKNSDSLYRELLSVKDVEVVAFLKRSNKVASAVEVGFRATYNAHIDVGAFASTFGGGGHKKASGATIKGSLKQVKEMLLQNFNNYYKNNFQGK